MKYEGNWTLDGLMDEFEQLTDVINDNRVSGDLDGMGFFLSDMPDLMEKINEVYYEETGQWIF